MASKNMVLIFTLVLLAVGTTPSFAAECGTGWVAFENKCFKLIDQLVSHDAAEQVCLQESPGDSIPPLATIKSAAEQDFLTNYVFTTSGVVDNVWLAAERITGTQFGWPDGSSLLYTNWHTNNPTSVSGNDCTEMVPKGVRTQKGQRDTVDGRWVDVDCARRNLILCQKSLSDWTLPQLQEAVIALQNQIQNEVKVELQTLTDNPVPLGFIYVQLPFQPAASSVWPNVQWQDVTSQYAGLFFRAEGGNSAGFGSTQQESAPAITQADYGWCIEGSDDCSYATSINLPTSGWSEYIRASYYYDLQATQMNGLRFNVGGGSGEVRPRNTAVRIFKRIA